MDAKPRTDIQIFPGSLRNGAGFSASISEMVNEENVGLLDINEISMKSEEIAEKNRIRFCLSNIQLMIGRMKLH